MAKLTVCYPAAGVGYLLWSGGIKTIADRAAKLPNVVVTRIYGWTEWRAIADDIKKQPADVRIVLFNHSMGSNAATWIAQEVYPRKIDFIFAIDPSVWPPVPYDLDGNVMKCICIHGTYFFSLVGHFILKAGVRFKGVLRVISRNEDHAVLDDDPEFQKLCVDEIAALAAS